jgi:hypothetical protein
MPREQRIATEETLKLMATVAENKGDERSANFCRALAGEKYPEPKPKTEISSR